MSRGNFLLAIIAAFVIGGMTSVALRERIVSERLARAKAETELARQETAGIGAQLTTALAIDSARAAEGDALKERLRRSEAQLAASRRDTPPAPLVTPDTCLPWANRAAGLERSLAKADGVIGDLKAIVTLDSTRISALRDTTASAIEKLAAVEKRLAKASELIPVKVSAPPRVLLIGEVRGYQQGPMEGMLALGSRILPNTDLYAGAVQDLSTGARRWTAGGRIAIRLR